MGCTIFPKLAAKTKRKGRACSIKPHPGGNKEDEKTLKKKKCRLVRSFSF
jgi:hypothetical protein